jgi:hypothetical protein
MAGLLGDSMDDPGIQGLLSLGFGLMNSRGNFGQALGQAGPQALDQYNQASQMLQRRKLLDQETQSRAQQMEMAQQQLAEFRRQSAEAEAQRGRDEQFRQMIPAPTGGPATSGPTEFGNFSLPGAPADPHASMLFQALQQKQIKPMEYLSATQKDRTPIKGSAGDMFFEPGTMRVLASVPKESEQPSAVKEYAYAKGQGYPGTFQQFVLEQKRAGASSVSVTTDGLGLKPKDRFEMEGKLADDFKGVTKLDNLVLSATSKIKTALSQSGAMKDQAAIYSFAKMLDPEGAVREADYAAIANTAGLADRVRGYLNRLATGEQLNPTQRTEMLGMMTAFENVAKKRVNAAKSDFSAQAGRYNLRPESVFSGAMNTDQAPVDAPAAPRATKRWNPTTGKFEAVGG